jgi:Zn-dependent protease with chaperone function
MMLGTYGAEANPENRRRVADERAARITAKREDLARKLEALKGGN